VVLLAAALAFGLGAFGLLFFFFFFFLRHSVLGSMSGTAGPTLPFPNPA
jgi:hypothetical protein